MAGSYSSEVLRHSILDRLAGTGGSHVSGDLRIGIEDLKNAVLRDVQWLLNTKRPLNLQMENLDETRSSILNYGIPDFTQFSAANGGDCQEVCSLMVEVLRRFEPRLDPRTVAVEHLDITSLTGIAAQFRIHAVLHVDPVRVPVTFDTIVEMDTGAVSLAAVD